MITENSAVIKLTDTFRNIFNCAGTIIVRSPGRVNIIGEHTDYNEGFVLPAAIDKAIYVAVSVREDNLIKLYSVDYSEIFEITIADIKPTAAWSTYILGVVDQLIKRGHRIQGFNLAIDGDIPIGAGLSSSAAVECAVVFALNELFNLGIDKMEMVKIAQKAEHNYAGVLCGIMDQFASMFGKKGHVIKLDCRTLEYEYRPLTLEGYRIVLFNTNVSHSLSSSAYNTRRQQCEQGVELVKKHYHHVKNLRDVTSAMLDECVLPHDKVVYEKCKYVVEEIQRLIDGCNDLANGNIKALGKKMFETHDGLSKMYEVSCDELDFLVNAVKNNPAVLGARMMGGGFGGCTINLVQEQYIPQLVENISTEYWEVMGLKLSAYIATIEDGTGLVTQKQFDRMV